MELDAGLGPLNTMVPLVFATLCALPTSIGLKSGTGFLLPLPSIPSPRSGVLRLVIEDGVDVVKSKEDWRARGGTGVVL